MNLVVDVGNTRVKFAVFKADKLLYKKAVDLERFIEIIRTLKKEYPELKNAIISSVASISKVQIKCLKHNFRLLELTHLTKVPFYNLYKTPNTLGLDRIALVSAAVYKYPNKNTLIIDAGTCITYDFVTQDNAYLGGAISPGIRTRYKALNNLTANLPLLNTEKPQFLVGDSTSTSMHVGVVHGVVNEIDGFVKRYKEKYSDLTIILTGGDANFLSEQLKSSIFANSNFILEGLNYILKFNSN